MSKEYTFNPGDFVVYPAHGVGQVSERQTASVGGQDVDTDRLRRAFVRLLVRHNVLLREADGLDRGQAVQRYSLGLQLHLGRHIGDAHQARDEQAREQTRREAQVYKQLSDGPHIRIRVRYDDNRGRRRDRYKGRRQIRVADHGALRRRRRRHVHLRQDHLPPLLQGLRARGVPR